MRYAVVGSCDLRTERAVWTVVIVLALQRTDRALNERVIDTDEAVVTRILSAAARAKAAALGEALALATYGVTDLILSALFVAIGGANTALGLARCSLGTVRFDADPRRAIITLAAVIVTVRCGLYVDDIH